MRDEAACARQRRRHRGHRLVPQHPDAMKTFRHHLQSVFVAMICAAVASGAPAWMRRTYYIGNSVTDTLRPVELAALAASRDFSNVWGRHIVWGAALDYIWNNQTNGFYDPPFGASSNALATFVWDVLSIQPFDRQLTSDTDYAGRFINTGLPHNSNMQVYVYSRWPRQSRFQSRGYDAWWLTNYSILVTGSFETRDYFQKLVNALRANWTNVLRYPPLLVPVGDSMYTFNQHIKAGHVPGITNIAQLYSDDIHLTSTGAYLAACAYFATLYQESPIGLAYDGYGLTDPALAAIIQTCVWDTVLFHPYSGVTPEPGALAVLLLVMLATWRPPV